MMIYSDIPAGENSPVVVNAIVEIPQGSSNKYEYNEALNTFVLDRVLYSPLYYPAEYGWIAGTLSEDGDPLDILVFVSHPTFPGCIIRSRPVGALHMHDEKGEDYKIISVADTDPRYAQTNSLNDITDHVRKEIVHFFSVYKQLEFKETDILGWLDIDEAHKIITTSIIRRNESRTYQH